LPNRNNIFDSNPCGGTDDTVGMVVVVLTAGVGGAVAVVAFVLLLALAAGAGGTTVMVGFAVLVAVGAALVENDVVVEAAALDY
jgi:hypothetical protein